MVSIVCGGGTTSPLPTTTAAVDVGAAALGVLFTEAGYPWLVPAIPLLNLAPFAPSTFCAADPPAQPSFTSAEANALLNLTLGADFTSGLAKLVTLAENIAWWNLCQCDNHTAVTYPAPSAAPSGTAVSLQVAPVANGAPCFTYGPANTGAMVAPGGVTSAGGCPWSANSATVNATTIVLGFRYNFVSGPFTAVSFELRWAASASDCAASIHYKVQDFPINQDGQWHYYTIALDPGAVGVIVQILNAVTTTDTVDYSSQWYCGGQSGSVSGCCPTDPIVIALLEAILSGLSAPGLATPGVLTAGTAHTALSGGGTITAANLKGVQVTLTSIPTSLGEVVGSPNVYFDAGWITPFTSEGPEAGSRVKYSTQYFPFDAFAEGFDYFFAPGVIATVTEVN